MGASPPRGGREPAWLHTLGAHDAWAVKHENDDCVFVDAAFVDALFSGDELWVKKQKVE